LRQKKYDLAIIPSGGYNRRGVSYAGFIGAKKILAYSGDKRDSRISLPMVPDGAKPRHEVEWCCNLLQPLGITQTPPALRLTVTGQEQAAFIDSRISDGKWLKQRPIGIHISARKPSNRWLQVYYIELIHKLWQQERRPLALFWSPGAEDDPRHPGDDGLAQGILEACQSINIRPVMTQSLRELIVAMSFCDRVFCSDGGAMHVAAGLGKPLVCLFGGSDVSRWHPWGVEHRVLQPPSRQVHDILPDQVLQALAQLQR
jgi:ADP-heptose:LPS heptosyltransferase